MIEIMQNSVTKSASGFGFSISGDYGEEELTVIFSDTYSSDGIKEMGGPLMAIASSVYGTLEVVCERLTEDKWVRSCDLHAVLAEILTDWCREEFPPTEEEVELIRLDVAEALDKIEAAVGPFDHPPRPPKHSRRFTVIEGGPGNGAT